MLSIKGNLMLEAYQAFVDAIKDLENERDASSTSALLDREPGPQFSEQQDWSRELDGAAAEASWSAAGAMGGGVYEPAFDAEDFPGRRSFDINQIDAEDPAFWSGRELGIPIGLSVHFSDGQDKLFPIVDGKFRDPSED